MSSKKIDQSLIIQAIDWKANDYQMEEEDDDSDSRGSSEEDNSDEKDSFYLPKKYTITLFGITADRKSVCVKIDDFTPFMYVEIPSKWKMGHVRLWMEHLEKESQKSESGRGYGQNNSFQPLLRDSGGIVQYSIVNRYKFRGFTYHPDPNCVCGKKQWVEIVLSMCQLQI